MRVLVVEDEERFAAGLKDGLEGRRASPSTSRPTGWTGCGWPGTPTTRSSSGRQRGGGDAGAVAGDVTSLELVRQRLRDGSRASAVGTADLRAARDAADRKDIAAAADLAPRLSADIAKLTG